MTESGDSARHCKCHSNHTREATARSPSITALLAPPSLWRTGMPRLPWLMACVCLAVGLSRSEIEERGGTCSNLGNRKSNRCHRTERERLRDQGPILWEQQYLQDGRRARAGIRSKSERQEEDLKGAASDREVSVSHGEPAAGVAAQSAQAPRMWLKRGRPDTQDRWRAHRTPRYWAPSEHSSQAESHFRRDTEI